jgi:formiminotetrahydrofolate cyclodeaminase
VKKNAERGPSSSALQLDEFIASVAGISPLLPAGGSVAALAGSLAAALGEMMSGVTEGREKFAVVDSQVREIHTKLSRFREGLRNLAHEDAEAFGSVMEAIKLPKETEELKMARAESLERALHAAIRTPLRIARASAEIMELLQVLVKVGNPNATCDAAVGVQMAYASLKGAQYNVLANIKRLKDKEFAGNCRTEVLELVQRGRVILQQVDEALTGT